MQQSLHMPVMLPEAFHRSWAQASGPHVVAFDVRAAECVDGRWTIALTVSGQRVAVLHRDCVEQAARDLFAKAYLVH